MVHDVDRPFMCYYEWKTDVRKRCDKHLQEYNEPCERDKQEKERKLQLQEERRQVVKSHLLSLMDIKHEHYIQIK